MDLFSLFSEQKNCFQSKEFYYQGLVEVIEKGDDRKIINFIKSVDDFRDLSKSNFYCAERLLTDTILKCKNQSGFNDVVLLMLKKKNFPTALNTIEILYLAKQYCDKNVVDTIERNIKKYKKNKW